MNEVFQVKPSAPYSLSDQYELYSWNPKKGDIWDSVNHFAESQNLVNSTSRNKNCNSLYSFKKRKEMESNLFMPVIKTYLQHAGFI